MWQVDRDLLMLSCKVRVKTEGPQTAILVHMSEASKSQSGPSERPPGCTGAETPPLPSLLE